MNSAMKSHFAKSAEKWEALYQALKRIEVGDGTITEARAMLKMAYPNITRDATVIQMIVMERKGYKGYIEGLRKNDGKLIIPLKVKITEKGHDYFREMIENAKELAASAGK